MKKNDIREVRIHLLRDMSTVTASTPFVLGNHYDVIMAQAKCSPEDKFDFWTGAKLALERLEEKMKPWTPKCGNHYFSISINSELFRRCNVNDCKDRFLISMGNCFKNTKEALVHKDEMLAKWQKILKYAEGLDNE